MADAAVMKNIPFAQIKLGDSASLEDVADLQVYRPAEGGPSAALGLSGKVIADLLTKLVETKLPGPGAQLISQSLTILRRPGDRGTLIASVVVVEKRPDGVIRLEARCVDSSGSQVARGEIELRPAEEQISLSSLAQPETHVVEHRGFRDVLGRASNGQAIPTAIAHPCSAAAIDAACEAAEAGLIVPILVGPVAKIQAAAKDAGRDIGGFRTVDAEHSHAAAAKAVELIRSGEAAMLMKGSLHTDELMGAVVSAAQGLRTDRRISHAYVMDVPDYPKPLIITDGAINIAPTLEDKADIVRNAIDLAHTLGVETPKVAILSAVETVNPAMISTLDAAALCKMGDRGQIAGAVIDGPLAFDNAVNAEAAAEKGIRSPVAGQADILVVPDLEAGNILAKQLTFLGDADAAGVVLGARAPIVLTSRADSLRTRLASCAVAVLLARRPGKASGPAQ